MITIRLRLQGSNSFGSTGSVSATLSALYCSFLKAWLCCRMLLLALQLLLLLGAGVGGADNVTVAGAPEGAVSIDWSYQSLENSGKFCPERDSCRYTESSARLENLNDSYTVLLSSMWRNFRPFPSIGRNFTSSATYSEIRQKISNSVCEYCNIVKIM